MKTVSFILVLVFFILLISCSSSTSEETATTEEHSDEGKLTAESDSHTSAVCLWKEVSLREIPSEKGKYVTSVSLGEEFEATSDTASETIDSRKIMYQLIKLSDGTTGWIRKDFIAVDAKAGAFKVDAVIYKRPDLITSTKKSFNYLDYVAIKKTSEDGWSEVIGKRKGDKWFTTGWVRSETLTTVDVDVHFSALYNVVSEIPNEVERQQEIDKLFLSDMFQESFFRQQNEENIEEVSDESEQGDFVETDYSEADTTSGNQ